MACGTEGLARLPILEEEYFAMKTHAEVYDACRYFIEDNRSLLSDPWYRKILGALRSRDLRALTDLKTWLGVRLEYLDADSLRVLHQIEAFFKKNSLFSDDTSCTSAAKEKFLAAERKCRITNRRLDHYYVQRDRLDRDLDLWMSRAERYVQRLLGDHVAFLEQLPMLLKVTGGATATRSRRNAQPPTKVSKRPVCTPAAQPLLHAASAYFGYGRVKASLINWNRVEVVPKNWKTHRTIACEPEGNLPFQLAFDAWAKGRLRKIGIDLSDQSLNQRLAKEGSISGNLATIDLSAASDTLSIGAVAWLLPYDWYTYLDRVRAPYYKGAFGIGRYAKFSSMGNGATFALETLVFAACAYAVGSKRYSVYGDDIIIETELASDLIRMLSFIGFSVNTDKSFTSGPFRESCGADYYKGTLVTPVYIRDVSANKQVLSHNVNSLVSVATPEGQLAEYLRSVVIRDKLLVVPFTERTNGGVWVDIHTAYERGLVWWKYSRVWFRTYIPRGRTRTIADSRALFLWFLSKSQIPDGKQPVRLTRYSRLSLKYKRKVRPWLVPRVATPVHLYWWAEFLYRG